MVRLHSHHTAEKEKKMFANMFLPQYVKHDEKKISLLAFYFEALGFLPFQEKKTTVILICQ